MFLPRENAHFVLAPVPILILGDAPVHAALPPLHAPNGQMPSCAGWTLIARLTLCVVDGPGDAGCMVPTLGASGEPDEMEGISAAWCSAAEEAGGAVVVSLEALPTELDWDELFTGGHARGGFIHAANA